eukprot:COSAG02_NODE_17677_length_988_cov_0.923510_1_plen_191_part_00
MTVEQYRTREQAKPRSSLATCAAASLRTQRPRTLSAVDDSDSGGWFYIDKNDEVQGPFGSARVREWADAGALTPEIKVRPWYEREFKQLEYYRRDGGPLASQQLLDAARTQPETTKPGGSGGATSSVWITVTEGQPPHIRHILWNTLTDEKRLVKPPAPPAPLPTHSGVTGATTGLEGLSGYTSSGSESD